jgi:hypothetical protein
MHKTIPIEDSEGMMIDIDKNIAHLIKIVWMCDIKTFSCCENDEVHHDYVHIQFESSHDFTKFMSIVTDFDECTEKEFDMYNKVLGSSNKQTIVYDSIDDFKAIGRDSDFLFRFNVCDELMFIADNPEDFDENNQHHSFKTNVDIAINCNLLFRVKLLDSIYDKFIKYVSRNLNFS